MRKRTTIDVDVNLVRQAAEALGTTRMTDTIHGALSDVIRRRLRRDIVRFRPTLSLDELQVMRAHRFEDI